MATKKRLDAPSVRSPVAASIVERWARSGSEVPLERIESELDGVARYDIVAALKELEKSRVGKLVVGRKGAKSRFVWNQELQASSLARVVAPATASKPARSKLDERKQPARLGVKRPSERKATQAAEGARTVPIDVARARAEEPSRVRAVGLGSPARTLEHAFYVRAGVLLKFQLPADITPPEIERLCQFLQAIPFR